MRPLRYSINVTLDGCCDHRAMFADEDLHRHAIENLDQADALLFGRVTYEMMEAAWRPSTRKAARPDWMEPFARTIDAAKKYVVSSTLDRVDWNAELMRGDLGTAVEQLKRQPGRGLFTGGVKLPLALAELGLIAGGRPQVGKADGDAPVEACIAAIPGWKGDVSRRLDALVARNVPSARKAVRWNSPFYGIEGQGWFLAFHVFTRYVKVTFFR